MATRKPVLIISKLLQLNNNVLILRLRMPVSDKLEPRNFVTKITKYSHVVDVPNSMSILHDLLPAAIMMTEKGDRGVYNFTNPGAISHNEVLTMYRDIVKPDFTWNNFTLEQQAGVIKAGRSNCELDATKLKNLIEQYGLELPDIHEAYRRCFERMKAGISEEQKMD